MFYFFLRATGSRERLRKNRIDELLEKEGKPIVVSKLRSWIRALGTWSEGVETEREQKARGGNIKQFGHFAIMS